VIYRIDDFASSSGSVGAVYALPSSSMGAERTPMQVKLAVKKINATNVS